MLLTDAEVLEIAEQLTWYDADVERLDPMQFARAVEAKIEAKLREQEPVAWVHSNGHIQCDGVGVPTHLYTVEKGWTPLFLNPAPIPDQKPFAWHSPTEGLSYENHYSDNLPLYMQVPAPIPECWKPIVANFIHQFKRHVGGDGEFWLHELEDFYNEMAARSGE